MYMKGRREGGEIRCASDARTKVKGNARSVGKSDAISAMRNKELMIRDLGNL